ncbi:hypothetical protein, conserved, partial [Babesia bigemina]
SCTESCDDGQPPLNPGSHVYNTVDDPKWRQIPPPAGWNPERKRSGERLSGSPRSPHNDDRNVDASNSKPSLSSLKGRSEDKNTPVAKPGGDREPTKPKPSNNGYNVSPSIVKPALSSKERTNPASSTIKQSVDDSKPSKNIPSGHGRNGQADVKQTSLNPNGKTEHPPSSFTRRDDVKNPAKTNDGNQALASDAKSSSSSPKVESDDKNTPVPKPDGDANAQAPTSGSQGSNKIPASVLKPLVSPGGKPQSERSKLTPPVDDTAATTNKPNKRRVRFDESIFRPSPSSPKVGSEDKNTPVAKPGGDANAQTPRPGSQGSRKIPASILKPSPSRDERGRVRTPPVKPLVDGTATPKEELSNSDETKLGSSNLKTAPSSPKGKVRFATDPIETSEDDEKPSTEKSVDDEDAEAKVETTSPSPKEARKFASSSIRKPVDGRPPTRKTSIPGKQVPGSGTNMSAGYPREMFDFEFIPMGNLHDKGDKYSQPHDERRFQIFDVRKLIEDDNKLPHKTMKVGENTPTTFNLPPPSLNGNKDRGILPVIPLTDANIPPTPGQDKPSTHYILVPKVEDNAQQATGMVHNNHAPKLSDAATQTSPSLPKENGKIIPIDIKSFIEDTKAATAMMARYSAPKMAEIATQTNISHLEEEEKVNPSLVVPSVDDKKPTTLNTDGKDKADTSDTKPSPSSARNGGEMKRFSAQPLADGLDSDLRSPSFEGNEENVDSFHLRKDANDNKPAKETQRWRDSLLYRISQS